MDLSFVKNKLQSFQPKEKKTYEKVDYTKYYFTPNVGKHQIRIVPCKFNQSFPVMEVYNHWGFKPYPILALSNWGEDDPINEFCQSLRKSKDPEDWNLAKKLSQKTQYITPVIVRGEEEKGVRFWSFGVTIYKQLLALAEDEDYGDFSSITEGRDFTLEVVEDMVLGKKQKKVAGLRIKPKVSPLSTDAEQAKRWLEEQTDVRTLNKKLSYDEIKQILENYLNSKSESDNEVVEDEKEEVKQPIPSFKTIPPKKKKSDEFDKLFEEDDQQSDDLPF